MRYKTRTHKVWTEADKVLLQEAYEGITPVKEIAQQLGRTAWSIMVKMNRMFGKRSGALVPSHYSVSELSEQLGVSKEYIHGYIRHDLKSYKRGRWRYVTRTELRKWLESGNCYRKFQPTEQMKDLIEESKQVHASRLQELNMLNRLQLMEMFDVSYQTITNWLRWKNFPKPTMRVQGKAQWQQNDIVAWAKSQNLQHKVEAYLSRGE